MRSTSIIVPILGIATSVIGAGAFVATFPAFNECMQAVNGMVPEPNKILNLNFLNILQTKMSASELSCGTDKLRMLIMQGALAAGALLPATLAIATWNEARHITKKQRRTIHDSLNNRPASVKTSSLPRPAND